MLAAQQAPSPQPYHLGPDSQHNPAIPHGTVTHYMLPPGAIYPGVPHAYWVYTPPHYDRSKPAPFMIFLDGSTFLRDTQRAPDVFDNLIAKHELPPLIGIFIDPGVLPALSDDAQSRYERIFEYDSISDRFSRFLLTELLPTISKTYPLSTNPDDHAIGGNSTGAVGSFIAAWRRPDQFHRVLSFIGTYVAMKGADSLPGLVRKTEPKPIRIFMQDGDNDHLTPNQPWGSSFAGSWPINNQVMYAALEYAGYDVTFVHGVGAHDNVQSAAILPDALRWLWRGYPQPIAARNPSAMDQPGWDPRGKPSTIVSLDKPWEPVTGAYSSAVSPVADEQGNVYFSDPAASRIYKVDADSGSVAVFKEHTESATALAIAPDGTLYAMQPERHRLVAYAAGGEKIIANGFTANAFALTKSGRLYYADTDHRILGFIDPVTNRSRNFPVTEQIAQPSALALSPDQAMLIVADAQSRFSWSFQLDHDGAPINGEPFYRLEQPESGWLSHTEAVAEDTLGQVYFATPFGVEMCEANGRVATILNSPAPGPLSALAFAGPEQTWLYVVEGSKLYRRPVKVHTATVGNPVKPPKPPL